MQDILQYTFEHNLQHEVEYRVGFIVHDKEKYTDEFSEQDKVPFTVRYNSKLKYTDEFIVQNIVEYTFE